MSDPFFVAGAVNAAVIAIFPNMELQNNCIKVLKDSDAVVLKFHIWKRFGNRKDSDANYSDMDSKYQEVHGFETKPYEDCLLSIAVVLEDSKGRDIERILNEDCGQHVQRRTMLGQCATRIGIRC